MGIVKYQKGDKINLDSLVSSINKRSNADFVKRLKQRNRQYIKDWASNNIATHKLSWATDDNGAIVFPSVQRIDGKLYDFTDPKNNRGKWDALDTAIERGDTLRMTPSEADLFTRNYKKYYPKFQTGGTVQDNTRVSRPIIMQGIPYRLKPNEFYFVDKKTGKKTLIKRKQETISEDKRSNYQRQQDDIKTKQIQKQQEQDKNYEQGIETIDALTKLALPSTYVGPLFNNNGKSYTDNLISGEGTGNTVGNVAIDLLTPFAVGGINKGLRLDRFYRIRQFSKALDSSSPKLEQIPLNIGWGPKQTISVSHASDTGDIQLFFPKRWDVVNEGANPHGIWFQGKLGTPRTDFTNPGKGAKAAKARALFANRPVQMQGNLTLEKPIITVGDAPNRSQLSYYVDNAGADGLIYNGVYDNGYNNNQVILSFKKMNKTNNNKSPIKPSIGDITNEAANYISKFSLKNGGKL